MSSSISFPVSVRTLINIVAVLRGTYVFLYLRDRRCVFQNLWYRSRYPASARVVYCWMSKKLLESKQGLEHEARIQPEYATWSLHVTVPINYVRSPTFSDIHDSRLPILYYQDRSASLIIKGNCHLRSVVTSCRVCFQP